MTKLPKGYIACKWCGYGVRIDANNGQCPQCKLHSGADEVKPPPKKRAAKAGGRARKTVPRKTPLDETLTGNVVAGIDPGARYTALVIRDGDVVLHSSTFVREKTQKPADWVRTVIPQILDVLQEFPNIPVGVEGVNAPTGFNRGKKAPLNPRDIINAGMVFGGLLVEFPEAIVIPPGGNGTQHMSHYPACLLGRRPKTLPGSGNGAGTRSHEQSAYDVAGKAAKEFYPTPAAKKAAPKKRATRKRTAKKRA